MASDPAPLRPGWREVPHARRLAQGDPHRTEILRRHHEALRGGQPVYNDPVSGFSVFTSDFLASRGYCCNSGCRHCPYVT